MECSGCHNVGVQRNEEQYVHSAATSTADSLLHRQTQQEASAVTPADVAVSQHQHSQQG